jgi:hypothetical protein
MFMIYSFNDLLMFRHNFRFYLTKIILFYRPKLYLLSKTA